MPAPIGHPPSNARQPHPAGVRPSAAASLQRFAGAATSLIGLVVLAGWAFEVALFKSMLPGLIEMKANTGLGFVLIGSALMLRTARPGWVRATARAAAALAALVGSSTLVEYTLGLDLGVDELLFRDGPQVISTFPPGRMAPTAAASFLVLGAGLLLSERGRRTQRWAEGLALPVLLAGLVALLGYAYGNGDPFGVGPFTKMALHAALALALASSGLLAALPQGRVFELVASEGIDGFVARRLLPAAIFVPVILGWLRLAGERAGLMNQPTSWALVMVLVVCVFAVLVWWSARSLQHLDCERKQMQKRAEAASRMAAVGTLASGVAHEINNPLAYVVSNLAFAERELPALSRWIESAQSGPGAGPGGNAMAAALREIRDAVSEASHGAARVQKIVQDLGVFSRADDGQSGPACPRKVIDSALTIVANQLKHRARLVTDYREVPSVQVNESRLGQVIVNLLVNAAQAIPEGRADLNEIRIATRTDPAGLAVIEVQDSGSGIAPEVLPRVFEPFFTTKDVGAGSGLGLSICQGTVAAAGGRMEVETELGRGSVFRLLLPPAPPAETSAPAIPAKPAQPWPVREPGERASPRPHSLDARSRRLAVRPGAGR